MRLTEPTFSIRYDGSDAHCPSFSDELPAVPSWADGLDTWSELKEAAEARLCSQHFRRPLSLNCDDIESECAEARALLSCDEFRDACAAGHCECAQWAYDSDIECAISLLTDSMSGATLWAVSGVQGGASPLWVPDKGRYVAREWQDFRNQLEALCGCLCHYYCAFSIEADDTHVIYRYGRCEVVLAVVSPQVEEAVELLSGGWSDNAHTSNGVESWVELLLGLETCQVERITEVARALDMAPDYFPGPSECEAFICQVLDADDDAITVALSLMIDSADFLDLLTGAELLAA